MEKGGTAPDYQGNPPPAYPGNPGQQYPPPGQQYPPPGQGYPPPGQQYPPPGQQYPPPAQAAPVVQTAPGVVVVTAGGNCPNCHTGYIREDYTCCGIALAILFFPLGLICCLLMKEKTCSHCGQHFG